MLTSCSWSELRLKFNRNDVMVPEENMEIELYKQKVLIDWYSCLSFFIIPPVEFIPAKSCQKSEARKITDISVCNISIDIMGTSFIHYNSEPVNEYYFDKEIF